MKIEMLGYRPEFHADVLDCMRRNYEWMGTAPISEVEKWMNPTLTYKWKDDIALEEFPYKYGVVLLADNIVVGFLGCMISRRYTNGFQYISLTGTNWCIDKDYRIYLFKILQSLFLKADVITDFTPRKSVEEVLANIFKFEYVNREKMRFVPIPYIDVRNINIEFIIPDQIEEDYLRTEYEDNIQYGVRCVLATKGIERSYIFYKVMNFRGKWVQIVKTINGKMFARHAHEIIWRIQQKECFEDNDNLTENFCDIIERTKRNEWMNLECDKIFFEDENINHPMYDSVPVVRMMLNKRKQEIQPQMDFMYSEMVMLDLR